MTQTACVVDHGPKGITFLVDDVEPAPDLLPEAPAVDVFQEALGGTPLMEFSHTAARVVANGVAPVHALVHAVSVAFAQHRPLVLGPDEIWITIAQGFAQHVNNNAEALRRRFVEFEGKKKLVIETPVSLPMWLAAEEWTQMIRDHVGKTVFDLLVCDFSTTSPIARTASLVVMMDAFKKYFDFVLRVICGIPRVTLLGTPEDWKEIRRRVAAMAEYDLAWWTTRLEAVCDGLVETAEGRPDLDFWKQIYSPLEDYGGELITGWIANLFPYLRESVSEQCTVRNEFVQWPLPAKAGRSKTHPLSCRQLPTGISMAPFRFVDAGKAGVVKKQARELVAGFIGVTQEPATGALRPEIGWALREGERFPMILSDLAAAGEGMNGPVDWGAVGGRKTWPIEIPADLIQILDVFDGGLIFPGARRHLRMLPYASWKRVGPVFGTVTLFASLSDGRYVGYQPARDVFVIDGWDVVVMPRNRNVEAEEEMAVGEARVIARSIRELFERLYDAEGECYFDEPEFTVPPHQSRVVPGG
jgi:hypothetical protein